MLQRKRQATSPQQTAKFEQYSEDQGPTLPEDDGDRTMAADEDEDDAEEELEVFDDPSHVPRIGRWIVPRPPPDARPPLYAIPIEAPDDPEDQPIMECECKTVSTEQAEMRSRQEGLVDIPQEASLTAAVDQEAATMVRQETAPLEEPIIPPVEQEATSVLPSLPPVPGSAITWPPLADLDHATAIDQLCRQVTSCPTIPAFLRGELTRLLIQGAVPLSNSSVDGADAAAFPWLSSRKLWMFSYTSSVDKRGQSPVIVCKPHSLSFDVIPAPARLAAQLTGSKFTQSPWVDPETGRPYRDDGTVTDPPEPIAPMPETTAVASLQESNEALRKQVADLVAEKEKLTSRLISAQAGETTAIENAQMCRTLYDQASQKARQAIAETTEHQERAEKLERQVAEGLSAHRERFRVAQASWNEVKRQLRDQIKLLSQSQERAQSAEVLQSVAEWRAWMAGEENRRKKRLREEREARELLERQMALEIEEEELEALREEAEAADREAAGESQSQGPFALGSSFTTDNDEGLADPQTQFEAAAQLDEIQRQEARQFLQAAREAEHLEAQQEAAKSPYDRMADGLLDATGAADPPSSSRRSALSAATMTESQRRQAEEDAAMAALANERELLRRGEDVADELSMWESSIGREEGTAEEVYPPPSASDFTASLFQATDGSDGQATTSAVASGLDSVNADALPLANGEDDVNVAEWITEDQETDGHRRRIVVNGDGLPRITTNGDAS